MIVGDKKVVGKKGRSGRKSGQSELMLICNINKYEPRFWELMDRFSKLDHKSNPLDRQHQLDRNKVFINTMAKFLDKMLPTLVAGVKDSPLEVNISQDEEQRITKTLDSIIGFVERSKK